MKLVYSGNELSIAYPELAKEWDYEKNSPIIPDMVTKGLDDKYWWICEKGHHYEAAIDKRVKGQGCPYCKNKRVLVGFNDLVTTHPQVAAEWDYEENENDPNTPNTPLEVTAGSNKRVHWKCSNGHKWVTSVNHRTSDSVKGPTGCPNCAATARSKVRSLDAAKINNFAKTYPHLAEQWYPTKNGDLKAEDVACKCNRKVWWKCDICGNEWQATVNHRTRDARSGLGCPCCAKTGSSLAEQVIYYYVHKAFPDALIRDRETIDGELDIYIPSIKTAVEFDGHVWHESEKAKEREIIKNNLCKENGIRLIRIRDKRLSVYDDVETIVLEQYENKYLTLAIEELFQKLNINDVDIDVDRDYYDSISQFKTYILNHSLEKQHTELLGEWDYEKNKLKPSQVLCYGREKFWWKCKDCGNEWQSDIGHRIGGRGCPICARARTVAARQRQLLENGSLAKKCPDLVKEWHPTKNGGLTPNDISFGSTKKVWWKCSKCGNEWETSPNTRKSQNCPECGKEKSRLSRKANYANKNNLLEKHPELCKQWHPTKNGDKKPSDYSAGTHSKAWWLCPICGYEWEAEIKSRALAGCGCPRCAGKCK